MSTLEQKYDPNVVIKAAYDKLSGHDLEGGQHVFQSALLNWVDDARESAAMENPEEMRETIATLWLAYAHFLIEGKQFKSATEAYDQAVNCEVAGSIGRLWLDYARFAEERGKLRTAQQVYLRALVGDGKTKPAAVQDPQDQTLLWTEFHTMMKKSNSDLTLNELRAAVINEHLATTTTTATDAAAPDAVDSSGAVAHPASSLASSSENLDQHPDTVMSAVSAEGGVMSTTDDKQEGPPSKRQRLPTNDNEGNDTNANRYDNNNNAVSIKTESGSTLPMDFTIPLVAMSNNNNQEQAKTHVVIPEEVEAETQLLCQMTQQNSLPPEIVAAWMVRDGDTPAQPPEPPLFGPAPPKLSDPTGADILGDEMALAVIRCLLKPSGSTLLEVCRGLWMSVALKERQAKKEITVLDESMLAEAERLESTHETRLSMAGPAAIAMNTNELANFQKNCGQRRIELLSRISWQFRQLLCMQQQLLTKLMAPGFEGPTVDARALHLQARICILLHSAFYVRKRIGSEQHNKMLKQHLIKLNKKKEEAAHMPTMMTTNHIPPPPKQPRGAPIIGGTAGLPPPPPQLLPPNNNPPPVPTMTSSGPMPMYGGPPAPHGAPPPPGIASYHAYQHPSQQQQHHQQQQQHPAGVAPQHPHHQQHQMQPPPPSYLMQQQQPPPPMNIGGYGVGMPQQQQMPPPGQQQQLIPPGTAGGMYHGQHRPLPPPQQQQHHHYYQ